MSTPTPSPAPSGGEPTPATGGPDPATAVPMPASPGATPPAPGAAQDQADYEEYMTRRERMLTTQDRARAARAALPAEVKAATARLEAIGTALSDATRWRLLLELGRGDALPVGELARRVGRPASAVSKHMALLLKSALVERAFGTCYRLPNALQPAPGATTIDLGPCLLKLELPA